MSSFDQACMSFWTNSRTNMNCKQHEKKKEEKARSEREKERERERERERRERRESVCGREREREREREEEGGKPKTQETKRFCFEGTLAQWPKDTMPKQSPRSSTQLTLSSSNAS